MDGLLLTMPSLTRKQIALIALAVVVSLASAGAAFWWLQPRPAPKPATKAAPPPARAADDLVAQGRLEAVDILPVLATIDGVLETATVDAGQEVYEGQLLAQIKNQQVEGERTQVEGEYLKTQERVTQLETLHAQARLEAFRAEADANQAKQTLDRLEKVYRRQELLYREGATPRLTFEKSMNEYENALKDSEARSSLARVAANRLAQVNKDLADSRKLVDSLNQEFDKASTALQAMQVYSPSSGIVLERVVQPGGPVKEGQEILRLTPSLSRLRVVLDVDESEAKLLKVGAAALVILGEAGEPVTGKIESIEKNVVRVEFANPDPTVKLGTAAQVRLKLT